MDIAAAADAIMRRRVLEDIYARMTPEERMFFAGTAERRQDKEEILQAVGRNREHLEKLAAHAEKDRWYTAFGSDVAANVLTTAGFWLLQKAFRK